LLYRNTAIKLGVLYRNTIIKLGVLYRALSFLRVLSAYTKYINVKEQQAPAATPIGTLPGPELRKVSMRTSSRVKAGALLLLLPESASNSPTSG
jgi:hypothetical protein